MSTSSQTAAPASPAPSDGDLAEAVARRRNFAVGTYDAVTPPQLKTR